MKRPLTYLILHCTATPTGRKVSASDIRRWHLSPPPAGRGWRRVGYTDMVHLDGSIERLSPNNEDEWVDSWEVTNGVRGKNTVSRHVVYVGGLDRFHKPCDTRTVKQKEALKGYVLDFVKRFPQVKVAGHYQFANKACPCFDVPKWLQSIGVERRNIYVI